MRPYYYDQKSGITIFNGDCKEIIPELHFDGLILTDSPYGINHPTNYQARGRDNLANCTDYIPVAGDHEPFDPRWLLPIGKAHIIWGANYFADLLPSQSGWLVWDKERPDDLDQSTCELAWTDYIKGVRRFRWLWNGMMRASKEPLTHPTQNRRHFYDGVSKLDGPRISRLFLIPIWVPVVRYAPPKIVADKQSALN